MKEQDQTKQLEATTTSNSDESGTNEGERQGGGGGGGDLRETSWLGSRRHWGARGGRARVPYAVHAALLLLAFQPKATGQSLAGKPSWTTNVLNVTAEEPAVILRAIAADDSGVNLPPTRRLPADTILLDNGSTTFVSTLEEYMAQDNSNSSSRNNNQPTTFDPPPGGHSSRDSLSTAPDQVRPFVSGVENATRVPTTTTRSTSTAAAATTTTAGAVAAVGGAELSVSPKPAALLQLLEHEGPASRGASVAVDVSLSPSSSATTTASSAPHHHQQPQPPPSPTTPKQQHQKHHGHGKPEATTTSTGNGSSKPILQHWQVKSLLNVSNDYPLAYSQIICGYVWPLMAALTLFTNLMIVFVLTQRDMRTPTNVVLTAIAIADIIPIVVPVPWFVYLFAMGNEKQVLYPPIACYFYQHSTRSVSEVFYFLSTWLNVLLAVQDYLTACRPKLAKRYCQIRVVIVEIVSLTLLAFLLNLPQALKIIFKPVQFYYRGQLTMGCRALQARWFKDLVGEHVALYDDIFTAIIVVFVDGGPAVALITLTALLIRQLHQQRIQGHLLMEQARTASKRRRERHRQQENEASARVMIFVLLAFLAVKIPFATTYTLMIIQSRFEIHFVENLNDFQKAITITDLVFVLSYPINFTIFCCCSKKFRHKCAQLFGDYSDSAKSAKSRFMSSFSSSTYSADTISSSKRESLAELAWAASSGARQNSIGPAKLVAANANSANNSIDITRQLEELKEKLIARSQLVELETLENGDVAAAAAAADHHHYQHAALLASNDKIHQEQRQAHKQTCDGGLHRSSHHPVASQPPQQENHHQAATPSATVTPRASFIDDGSLCIECIMRYEQMKRESQTNERRPSSEVDGSQAAAAAAAAAQRIVACRRRSSQDSTTSSLLLLPPPPPQPQIAQYQLPHIITTRCESIREQSSQEDDLHEEATSTNGADEASDHQKRAPPAASAADGQHGAQQQRGARAISNASSTMSQGGMGEWSLGDETTSQASDRQQQQQQQQHHHHNQRQHRLRMPHGLRDIGGACWSLRGSSDPGTSLAQRLSGLLSRSGDVSSSSAATSPKRRTSGGGGVGEPGKLGVGGEDKKGGGRLSMSHSQIATLPNATGLLAETMMSTLLDSTLGPGTAAAATSAFGARGGTVSEPPIHYWGRHHEHHHHGGGGGGGGGEAKAKRGK